MSKTTLEQKWPAKEPSLASRMNMLTQSRQIMPDQLAEDDDQPSFLRNLSRSIKRIGREQRIEVDLSRPPLGCSD
jgi:hypothetical protein